MPDCSICPEFKIGWDDSALGRTCAVRETANHLRKTTFSCTSRRQGRLELCHFLWPLANSADSTLGTKALLRFLRLRTGHSSLDHRQRECLIICSVSRCGVHLFILGGSCSYFCFCTIYFPFNFRACINDFLFQELYTVFRTLLATFHCFSFLKFLVCLYSSLYSPHLV